VVIAVRKFASRFVTNKTSQRWAIYIYGARGGVVVEALRYKPEGREIDSRWCQWNFSLT
jgi:hypothetical protein